MEITPAFSPGPWITADRKSAASSDGSSRTCTSSARSTWPKDTSSSQSARGRSVAEYVGIPRGLRRARRPARVILGSFGIMVAGRLLSPYVGEIGQRETFFRPCPQSECLVQIRSAAPAREAIHSACALRTCGRAAQLLSTSVNQAFDSASRPSGPAARRNAPRLARRSRPTARDIRQAPPANRPTASNDRRRADASPDW